MKTWTIHCLNSRSELSLYMERIEEAISTVNYKASTVVPTIWLDIVVQSIVNGGIPEIGHCGYCPRPGAIYLIIDPKNQNLEKHLGESLERVIAHELHHALRWDTVGYGKTLLEVIVSEGLAGRFVEELYSNEPEPWESSLSSEELGKYSHKALLESDSRKYNHRHWFFGAGDIPRWAGYTIGWELIGNLSGNMTGIKPSKLISTSGAAFKESLEVLARKNSSQS